MARRSHGHLAPPHVAQDCPIEALRHHLEDALAGAAPVDLHHQARAFRRAAEPLLAQRKGAVPAQSRGAQLGRRLEHPLPDQRAVGEDADEPLGPVPQEGREVLVILLFGEVLEPGPGARIGHLAMHEADVSLGQARDLGHGTSLPDREPRRQPPLTAAWIKFLVTWPYSGRQS